MKKIRVVGAGFSGLATAYYLARNGFQVQLYAPQGIGGGASSVSAGLLHPFVGMHSKLNWQGREGMAETLDLIEISEKAIGYPVAKKEGILRFATTQKQAEDFKTCADQYDEVDWYCAEKASKKLPFVVPYPAIYLKTGLAVDVKAYLCGLWYACEKLGAVLHVNKIDSLTSSPTVLAMGYDVKQLLPELKLTPIKGQILRLSWPKSIAPLPFPISSKSYLVMAHDNKSCWVGATFERNFETEGTDLKAAKDYILPSAYQLIPLLEQSNIIDCQTGIRASTPSRLPFIKKVKSNLWVITGMGSKGLLYHALLAKKLVAEIVDQVV